MNFLQSNVRRQTGVIIIAYHTFRHFIIPATYQSVSAANAADICASATMATHLTSFLLLAVLSCLFVSRASARILNECDSAKELVRAGIGRTYISNYVCIMKNDGDFNTKKKTGPGHKASYSYGIFQISSDKWCNAFRPGGICNKNCNDFLNDDIQDDIACAKIIADREGFKHWKGWVKKCKSGQLPNVTGCIIRRDVSNEESLDLELLDEELLANDTMNVVVPAEIANE